VPKTIVANLAGISSRSEPLQPIALQTAYQMLLAEDCPMQTQSDAGRLPSICGPPIATPEQLLPASRWRRSKPVHLASEEISCSLGKLRLKCIA
jgi:hypothetical protein